MPKIEIELELTVWKVTYVQYNTSLIREWITSIIYVVSNVRGGQWMIVWTPI